ncbi:MAG: hypothetical protein LZ158_02750 [Thaumarchaeota archaeon]|jgi:cation transport ATPase|nr:hypothetical protein [Candidatus Terraquivivens yellowstonensis]MCL7397904.1 hypothetical protein [Candidatus Terraquivivens yellowstonensis]
MKARPVLLLLASTLSFAAGSLITVFYIQPKIFAESIVRLITWPTNVLPEYLKGMTTSFVEWHYSIVSNPAVAWAFGILTAFSACVMAYAAWRLVLISRGFRKAALAAGGGYVATALALTGLSGEFRRAKMIFIPLAAMLFIFVLIGLILMRLNERVAQPRRTGAQKPERARRVNRE